MTPEETFVIESAIQWPTVEPRTEEVNNPRSFRAAELSPKPGSLSADLRFTGYICAFRDKIPLVKAMWRYLERKLH